MSNTDWWAKQLGTQQQQVPQPRPAAMPMPPSQQPSTPAYTPQVPQASQTPRGLTSSSQTEMCPDCRSTNYMSVQGAKPRCMDCGYPVEQSGGRFGALAGAKVEGSAKAALGNDTTNNYNPQNIIGRVN